jgi:hypothetical protein
MAPKRQKAEAKASGLLVSSTGADDRASSSKISDFFTPASSPRGYCSATSHATDSCAASEPCSDLREGIELEHRSKDNTPSSLDPQKQGSQVVYYFQRHEVGIEDDNAFFVVRRLLGPSGDNLATISEASHGAKVWISGQCCGPQDGVASERTGPLCISIRGTSQSSIQRASVLVQELLHATRAKYNRLIAGSTTGQLHLGADAVFACSFKVGIEDDSSFQVVKRLVGKNGKNMKRIEADAPGSSVRVCGRRGNSQSYDDEPLTVDVSAVDPESFEAASASVMALLTRVHADFQEFCVVSGKEVPLLAIRSEEGLPQPGP